MFAALEYRAEVKFVITVLTTIPMVRPSDTEPKGQVIKDLKGRIRYAKSFKPMAFRLRDGLDDHYAATYINKGKNIFVN